MIGFVEYLTEDDIGMNDCYLSVFRMRVEVDLSRQPSLVEIMMTLCK